MIFREAELSDITLMSILRNQVKENILSDPGLVTENDYQNYLGNRGKGWVCVCNDRMAGFAIVDLEKNNVWALFVHPEFEKQGIGRRLQEIMLSWYFSHTQDTIWLSTGSNTRAEHFYQESGWKLIGPYGKGEVKFAMSYEDWRNS